MWRSAKAAAPMGFPVWLSGAGRAGTPADVAGALRVPALVVSSDVDRDAPPELAESFVAASEGRAIAYRVPGAGHGFNLLRTGVAGQETWTPLADRVERWIAAGD